MEIGCVYMLIIVAYDICVMDREGEKRLRKVAKFCERYGVRVQNSLFEMILDFTQFKNLRSELEKIIDNTRDSLRYYSLGNEWEGKVYKDGVSNAIQQGKTLIV